MVSIPCVARTFLTFSVKLVEKNSENEVYIIIMFLVTSQNKGGGVPSMRPPPFQNKGRPWCPLNFVMS